MPLVAYSTRVDEGLKMELDSLLVRLRKTVQQATEEMIDIYVTPARQIPPGSGPAVTAKVYDEFLSGKHRQIVFIDTQHGTESASGLENSTAEKHSNPDEAKAGQYAEDNRKLHDLLEEILQSGIESFIKGIVANLECWGEVARFAKGANVENPGDLQESAKALVASWNSRTSRAQEHAKSTKQRDRPKGTPDTKGSSSRG